MLTTMLARLLPVFLTTSLFLPSFVSGADPGEKGAKYLVKIHELLTERKYADALTSCDQVIRWRSDFAEAYQLRGVAYAYLGHPEKSLENYAEAIRLKPDLAAAYESRAGLHRVAGRFTEALLDYTTLIRLKPAETNPLRLRATVYRVMKDPQSALADLNHALELDPKDEQLINERVATLAEAGSGSSPASPLALHPTSVAAATKPKEVTPGVPQATVVAQSATPPAKTAASVVPPPPIAEARPTAATNSPERSISQMAVIPTAKAVGADPVSVSPSSKTQEAPIVKGVEQPRQPAPPSATNAAASPSSRAPEKAAQAPKPVEQPKQAASLSAKIDVPPLPPVSAETAGEPGLSNAGMKPAVKIVKGISVKPSGGPGPGVSPGRSVPEDKQHFETAQVHMAHQEYLQALYEYSQAILWNPNYAEAFQARAELKTVLGDTVGAKDDRSQAAKVLKR